MVAHTQELSNAKEPGVPAMYGAFCSLAGPCWHILLLHKGMAAVSREV
jgi:hypothetical protein